MSPSDITAIQDALLRKCMNYGRVVHIIVDKRSLFVSVLATYLQYYLTHAYINCALYSPFLVKMFGYQKLIFVPVLLILSMY